MNVEQARAALSKVDDQGTKDVLASGLVQNLSVSGEEVRIELLYDVAHGMNDRIRIESGIRTALKMAGWEKKVTLLPVVKTAPVAAPSEPVGGGGLVGLGRQAKPPQGGHQAHQHTHGPQGPPGPPSMAARRVAQAPSAKKEIPGVKHVVAVASGKGGVGKSTIASNLACALAKSGKKTGLLDNDVFGPSLPILFAVHEQPKVTEDRKLLPIEKYGVKLMSLGFVMDEGAPAIWRGPIVMQVTDQLMFDTSWGELDYLILDLPPGTGDVQLTLAQKAPLTGAVIVSTPQDIALADAERGLRMFNRVEVPVLGIVENMSQFVCPHCGKASDIFSHGGARLKAKELGVDFLGEFPLDPDTRAAGDIGKPVVVAQPDSPMAKEFMKLAQAVIERSERLRGTDLGSRIKILN